MKRTLVAACMVLVACQPAEPEQPADKGAEISVDELGYPTKRPDGSPLTAAFCDTEEAERIYDNIKTCSMVACSQGDKESCQIAQTFATQHAPEEPAGAKVTEPAKLEGMAYNRARDIILKFGWKPLPGGCGGGALNDEACRRFPEIGNCSGTGVGFCDMTFVRQSRCLTLVTFGGAPIGPNGGDTVIRDVMFGRGPCSKDPND